MISVIAKLNKSSRARLSWIQSFAASFGIVPRPIYGHITLCPVEESAIETCKTALARLEPIPVHVESIDVLNNAVVALASAVGLEDVRQKLGAEDTWTPHVELLRDNMVSLSWVKMAMAEMFEPFTATADRIEFVRDTGQGFEVLDAIDLE